MDREEKEGQVELSRKDFLEINDMYVMILLMQNYLCVDMDRYIKIEKGRWGRSFEGKNILVYFMFILGEGLQIVIIIQW